MTTTQFQIIQDKDSWEGFVTHHFQANFLQSYNWGLFQQRLKKCFFAIGLFQGGYQVGAAMIIKEKAKRGNYLTIAGGPLINWQDSNLQEIFSALTNYLRQLAHQEKCHFVRVRPQADDTPILRKLFEKNGFISSPMHLTADLTLRLDLNQTEDQLLSQMRKNTRYEIKKAQKLGVITKIIIAPSFIDEFYQHQLCLADKHQFVPFELIFLRKQFESFYQDNQVAFINSYYQEQLLASAFVIFYEKEAVYHYGISTPANEKLPGSYAVQWTAIKEARNRGCGEYNFWGVSPLDKPGHRFAGPSLFKRGFGGYEVQHLPAHDLPITKFYPLIKTFELARKRVRKL